MQYVLSQLALRTSPWPARLRKNWAPPGPAAEVAQARALKLIRVSGGPTIVLRQAKVQSARHAAEAALTRALKAATHKPDPLAGRVMGEGQVPAKGDRAATFRHHIDHMCHGSLLEPLNFQGRCGVRKNAQQIHRINRKVRCRVAGIIHNPRGRRALQPARSQGPQNHPVAHWRPAQHPAKPHP